MSVQDQPLVELYDATGNLLDDARTLTSLRNQRESPLLRLPAELCNIIYSYAMSGFQIGFKRRSPMPKASVLATVINTAEPILTQTFLSLTETCRQVHHDTAILPIKLNEISGEIDSLKPVLYGNFFHDKYRLNITHIRILTTVAEVKMSSRRGYYIGKTLRYMLLVLKQLRVLERVTIECKLVKRKHMRRWNGLEKCLVVGVKEILGKGERGKGVTVAVVGTYVRRVG